MNLYVPLDLKVIILLVSLTVAMYVLFHFALDKDYHKCWIQGIPWLLFVVVVFVAIIKKMGMQL